MPAAAPLLLLGAAAAAAASRSQRVAQGGAPPTDPGPGVRYAGFLREFNLSLLRAREGPSARRAREELFERRSAQVQALNGLASASWRATVNRFADHTDDELKAHFGFRSAAWGRPAPAASFLRRRAHADRRAAGPGLPEEVDWTARLASGRRVLYQGMCGSCWAVAATGALETHMEIAHGNASELSYEQILHCTPNPRNCGGPGGCGGATSELAFEYVREHGIDADRFAEGACDARGDDRARVMVSGFVKLPANQATPLMEAVASRGPVVVGVDASNWFPYESGVFTACDENPVIGHAVLLMGYGAVPGARYWLIRNSWGEGWGERGFIRLFRYGGEGDDSHCGVDSDPQQGVGCDGGPSQVTVCGMCGILADAAYPVGLDVVPARLARTASASRPGRAALG